MRRGHGENVGALGKWTGEWTQGGHVGDIGISGQTPGRMQAFKKARGYR